MTDPVAEAAAQLAAQAAPEQPGIISEIVDEFKALGEKVEHLIHPDAPEVAQPGESTTLSSNSSGSVSEASASPESIGNAANAIAESPMSTKNEEVTASGAGATTETAIAGEVPNVAPAAAEQPATPPSVPPASTPAGIVGIVASSEAEPVTLASAAAAGIRVHIAAIKSHLRIHGFEQSVVADIHAQLDSIEKWL